MGLWEKLLGKAASAVNMTLAGQAQYEKIEIHDALCAACMGWMKFPDLTVLYPLAVRFQPQKPTREALDLGGWCQRCDRILCPNELEWVQFHAKGDDVWVAGCRECQMPVLGKRTRTERKGDST